MAGSFTSNRFRFEVEGSDWANDQERGFRAELQDDEFDLRLTRTGKLPDLDGAPVASWILARLARLTDDCLGLEGEDHVAGGDYLVEFVVYRTTVRPDPEKEGGGQLLMFGLQESDLYVESEKPVGSFQFQVGMEGAAVVGQRAPDCPGEEILKALAAALLAGPLDLMPRALASYGPDWDHDPGAYTPRPDKESRNWYGWDGSQFLGKDNIRERGRRESN